MTLLRGLAQYKSRNAFSKVRSSSFNAWSLRQSHNLSKLSRSLGHGHGRPRPCYCVRAALAPSQHWTETLILGLKPCIAREQQACCGSLSLLPKLNPIDTRAQNVDIASRDGSAARTAAKKAPDAGHSPQTSQPHNSSAEDQEAEGLRIFYWSCQTRLATQICTVFCNSPPLTWCTLRHSSRHTSE